MKLKTVLMLCLLIILFGNMSPGLYAQGGPQAICVPWLVDDEDYSSPASCHNAYSGAEVTLKGIARNGVVEYRWDFGDSTGTVWMPISDPYNLGVKHTYIGIVGQLFHATLYVRDASGSLGQDDYGVRIYESTDLSIKAHLNVRINMAIEEGLWYLHTHLNRATYGGGSPGYAQPYGYWTDTQYGYHIASTGVAVDAFQLQGSKVNKDYDSDPYVETVQRALNYLLTHTYSFNIGVQSAGDPDTNGNGIGLVTNYSSNLSDSRQTYIGGICLTALASSGAGNNIAGVGGANVYGRFYKDIVQDMVDFFAWGQVESSSSYHRGGWRYHANYGNADMSTAQWPPLGMTAAEDNMDANVPQFVRDELALYLNALQYTGANSNHGAFGYASPTSYLNVTKAAAGIICHKFLGTPLTDSKVESAIGFIYRHWNDNGGSWNYTKLHGNSYGMYGVMKACRQPDIAKITEYNYAAVPPGQDANSFDWYSTPLGQSQQGLASYCVATQQADGSWDDISGPNPVRDAFCTGWRVLVLLKGVTIIPPVAVICDDDEQEYMLNQDINLDGTCSYHPDSARSIVSYEWDLDNDGVFEIVGPTASIPGGFPWIGLYPVTLRVIDDNPSGGLTDITVCQVDVHEPPHCPHAFAGGPYMGWIGVPVMLDGSKSRDPDNEIISYEWDLDNDGLFGTDDNDCFGQSSDAVGVKPEWIWNIVYKGVIGLRVTDAPSDIKGVHYDSCSDVDYSTVEIGNHTPTSNPGGPYTALPGSTITLNGTGSSDLDPGDSITYAWDLNHDGDFSDSLSSTPAITVGAVIGTVYDIGLRVMDSFGKYEDEYTTVTIVDWVLPVADADGPYQGMAGIPIILDASKSYDLDGSIVLYEWDWESDGTYDYSTAQATCSHTWSSKFTGNIRLRVSDNQGFIDTDTALVEMSGVPRVADAGGPYQGNTGEAVSFDASNSHDSDSSIVLYEWDWDNDGIYDFSTVDPVCTHVWWVEHAGLVKLRTIDDDGFQDTDTETVLIYAGDISDLVEISFSELRHLRATDQSSVTVTLSNISNQVISTPVRFAVKSISTLAVTLVNSDGMTQDGHPFYDITSLLEEGELSPGETVNTRVFFANPARERFTFTATVYGLAH